MEYFWLRGLAALVLCATALVGYLVILKQRSIPEEEAVEWQQRPTPKRQQVAAKKKKRQQVKKKQPEILIKDDLQESLRKALHDSDEEEPEVEDRSEAVVEPQVELTRAARLKLQEVNSKLFNQYSEVKSQLKKTKLDRRRKIFGKNSFVTKDDLLADSEDDDQEIRQIRKLPITETAEALKKAIVDVQRRVAEELKELGNANDSQETETRGGGGRRVNKVQDGDWQAVGTASSSSTGAKRKKNIATAPKSNQKYNPDDWEFESVKAPVVDHGGFVWDDAPASTGTGTNTTSNQKRKVAKPQQPAIPGLVYI